MPIGNNFRDNIKQLVSLGLLNQSDANKVLNETDKVGNLKDESDEYVTMHISSINPKLREQLDTLFYKNVVKKFEEMSHIRISDRWREIKRRFAMNYGKEMKRKSSNTYWYDNRYRMWVTPGIAKPIKPENVDKFGAATDFLKETILNTLMAHRNSLEFEAIIEYTVINSRRSPTYVFRLNESMFARKYPLWLSRILEKRTGIGLMEYLFPQPGTSEYAILLSAALEVFNRMISSAAELSGVEGLARTGR